MSVTTAVYEWTGKFMNNICSLTDCPQPGQAHRVVTPEVFVAAEDIVKENRRVTVNEIAIHLDMSHGSAHHVVRDKKKMKLYNSFIWLILVYIRAVCVVFCWQTHCNVPTAAC